MSKITLEDLKNLTKESKARVSKLRFGDPVTNICAGENNPTRLGYFVRTRTVNKEKCVQCTDKKGTFWDSGIDVIHPGHLSYDECRELFKPVWEMRCSPNRH